MFSEIFYFSGTGNSLAAARMINEKSAEKSEIIPIAAYDGDPVTKADRVCFVFPVYCHKAPDIVRRFLQRLEFVSSPYIYAVATHAGEPGQSLFDIQALLAKKRQLLSLGVALNMPGNAIVTDPDVDLECLSLLGERTEKIAKLLETQEKGSVDGKNSMGEHIRNKIVGFVACNYVFAPRRFKVSGDCAGCGACEKLCPIDNIHLTNHKPEWEKKCAACLACFHWCPKEAIYMDNFVIKKRRKYHNPDISANDMISAKGLRPKGTG